MSMGTFEKTFVNAAHHGRRVADRLDRLLTLCQPQPGQTYLDVGCGAGYALQRLSQRYLLDCMGVDIDPGQIRLAQQNAQGQPRLRFAVEDATNLPYPSGSFDLVSSVKVTHHIPRWQSAIQEMARVLKPGGYLMYIDFAFPDWLVAMAQPLFGNRMGFPTLRQLQPLVQGLGLETVHHARRGLQQEILWHRLNA